jgi:hypothetical protein
MTHDAKTTVEVVFARALVEYTGAVTNAELDAVRKVG